MVVVELTGRRSAVLPVVDDCLHRRDGSRRGQAHAAGVEVPGRTGELLAVVIEHRASLHRVDGAARRFPSSARSTPWMRATIVA